MVHLISQGKVSLLRPSFANVYCVCYKVRLPGFFTEYLRPMANQRAIIEERLSTITKTYLCVARRCDTTLVNSPTCDMRIILQIAFALKAGVL